MLFLALSALAIACAQAVVMIPAPCSEAPVCASDGQSYTNLNEVNCIAKCTRNPYLKAVKVGKCDDTCICPLLNAPVCGSNGVTYSNPCVLKCARRKDHRIQQIDNKPCNEVCMSRCGKEYNPICGSDGITYFNKEIFNCVCTTKTVKRVSDGECPCLCPKMYKPVCGTDGITYSNECELVCGKRKNVDLKVKYEGICIKPCACSLDLNPVCGSDGRTYTNRCMCECAQVNGKPGLHVKYVGSCKVHDESSSSSSDSSFSSNESR